LYDEHQTICNSLQSFIMRPFRFARLLVPLTLVLSASAAAAHYHMLLPASASVKRGEAAPLLYRWGHPFEAQLFDADLPEQFFALAPDGKKIDLLKSLEKDPSADKVGYKARFTPAERGDYILLSTHAPLWMEEDSEFLQDSVKVILHVQAQKSWDANAGQPFELVPLTRPYGLKAGSVFQAQVLLDGKPAPGCLVEIERHNAKPPKELPPDEQITRTARTDPNGVMTTTLTEPGWWCVTAQKEAGMREHKGKNYPVRRRATLWVFVDK
jgi:cobalt/nickel transport protein